MDVDLNDYYARATGKKRMYDGAYVEFFLDLVEDIRESEKVGRPIYKEVESVKVKFPGMDETVVRVEQQHKDQYPEKYKAFKDGLTQPEEGTPLESWAMMPRPIVMEIKHFGVRTIEQLAASSDDARRKLGPLGNWIKKAKDHIKAASGGPNMVVALQQLNEQLEAKVRKYEDQIELLIRRVESLEGNRFDGGRINRDVA
jgi:hypothetical protein